MPTSGWRSRVPPNHAATRPDRVSTIVDAWHCGVGDGSAMNSVMSTADGPRLAATVAARQPQTSETRRGRMLSRYFPLFTIP